MPSPIVETVEPALLGGVRRVAALWVGRLGDLIIATPFLRSLRSRFPEARILLVTGEAAAEAGPLIADADEVMALRSAGSPLANLRLFWALAGKHDLLVDLNSAFSRSAAALSVLSGAPLRLGFDKGRWGKVLTHRIPAPSTEEHMLDRYARLAGSLGAPYDPAPRLTVPGAEVPKARELLERLEDGAGGGLRVIIHPGNFKKFENRWPEEKFIELTERLLRHGGLRLLYLAGPGEEGPVEALVGRLSRPVPVIPPMPLALSAAVLSLADLLVVNATGTAHLAAAVGTPTVSFLSRYTRSVWMPRSGPHRCAVSKSWESCRDIPVEEAWAAVEEGLAAARGAGDRSSR